MAGEEAPTLTEKEQKKAASSKLKKSILKQSLGNPYKVSWPSLSQDENDMILSTFAKNLHQLMTEVGIPESKTTSEDRKESPEKLRHKNIRKQMVCGVNQVMKNLERDTLRSFAVCRSALPLLPTKPLLMLSATRNCPSVCLANFSNKICKHVQLKSLMAFGIKKSTADDVRVPELDEIVKVVIERAPSITVPWLPEPKQIDLLLDEAMEGCEDSSQETKSEDEKEGKKQLTFEYQIASIKHVKPNPNKVRKKKKMNK